MDLGDRKHAVCVLSASGEVLWEGSIVNERAALSKLSGKYAGALIVMEVGMQSPRTSRHFQELGHRVLVANARKMRAIYQNDRKSDRRDAEILARLERTGATVEQIPVPIVERQLGVSKVGPFDSIRIFGQLWRLRRMLDAPHET